MKMEILAIALSFVLLGCISSVPKLKETGFCSDVKESIADNFQVYGLFLNEGSGSNDEMHYCEYYLGNTKSLQLLYYEEPDPEHAFFSSFNSIKAKATGEYGILSSRSTRGNISSFYVELLSSKNNAMTVYAAAYDDHSSITLSAVYMPGFPNPFTNGRMLEKIAILALKRANN